MAMSLPRQKPYPAESGQVSDSLVASGSCFAKETGFVFRVVTR